MSKYRIKLDTNNLQTFGVAVPCCGQRIWYGREDFQPGYIWHCKHFGKPLIVVSEDGIPYYVGAPVFL